MDYTTRCLGEHMGFRGMGFGSLLLLFVIVMVLFGTKRLREIGSDLGAAVRSFRKGLQEEEEETKP
jgi:sec-independent protein translocase protein TatA